MRALPDFYLYRVLRWLGTFHQVVHRAVVSRFRRNYVIVVRADSHNRDVHHFTLTRRAA